MLTLNPDAYERLIRPLLFRLPPETAQQMADFVLKRRGVWRTVAPKMRAQGDSLKAVLCGIELDNPVGLAAGYDKNCEFLPSLASLGFGYVVGGTVTESPRPGNPKPRMFRYVKERSLINALGFPGRGLDVVARNLEKDMDSMGQTPVVVSVSGNTVDEIVNCHRRLEPLINAIEVNISSPNTRGLRVFQKLPAFTELISRVNDGRKKPLFVKLPPYASNSTELSGGESQERVLGLVKVCVEQGVDAVTVANTWPTRDSRLAVGMGGLSGKLVFSDMLRMVAEIKNEVGDRMAVNACGGISTGRDAWEAFSAGATTVQLLTGLIYRGPGMVKRINEELLGIMGGEAADITFKDK